MTSKYFLTLSREAYLAEPVLSKGGYLIERDGTTHVILCWGAHGIVMALLNPEDAALAGYYIPKDQENMLPGLFQAFQIENARHYDYMRVATNTLFHRCTVDLGYAAATTEQLEVLTAIGRIAGLQHNDEVNIEEWDRRWRERQSWLTSKTNAYGNARERQPYLKTFSGEHVYKEPQ